MHFLQVLIVSSCCFRLSYLQDYWSTTVGLPSSDSKQNFNLIKASEAGGYTNVEFNRDATTGDDKDVQFMVSSSIRKSVEYRKIPVISAPPLKLCRVSCFISRCKCCIIKGRISPRLRLPIVLATSTFHTCRLANSIRLLYHLSQSYLIAYSSCYSYYVLRKGFSLILGLFSWNSSTLPID